LSARARRCLVLGVVAAFVAALTVGNAAAATPSGNRMHVNPVISPAPSAGTTRVGSNYGLRTCQVGLSVGQCYDPYQMRTAYGVDSLIANGYDGTGKTIVIVDAFMDPNIVDQLNFFDTYYGLPQMNAGPGSPTFTQISPDGVPPYNPGWAEEISLDVLWAHAIAPGANIVLEQGLDNSDESLISALNDAIDNNRGDVVSMSFGESDTCLGPDLTAQWHQAFVNATKKGITLFASSGDQGAALPSCDGNGWIKSTSSPASDPLVTGVGGTELHAADFCLPQLNCNPLANPAPGTYLSETVWNEGDPFGDFGNVFGFGTISGGGGYSDVWKAPAYQQGTLHGGKQRGEPDVSYNGAVLHGVLVYLAIPGVCSGTNCWFRFGGTSAGSPQWAALTAIADQAAGHDYGFINAALYKTGQNGGTYANAFNDVTTGNNNSAELNADNTIATIMGYNAGPGWDAVTGLGTPKAGGVLSGLAANWSAGQGTAAIVGSSHG